MHLVADPTDLACFKHPFLSPDAWADVESARLTEQSGMASMVCLFLCKVRDTCPMHNGVESVAAGGWYDSSGAFIRPEPGEMEMHQAAAYIGIQVDRLRGICGAQGIKRTRMWRQMSFLRFSDVQQLAKKYHPEHGTFRALLVHKLRGQPNCSFCTELLALAS